MEKFLYNLGISYDSETVFEHDIYISSATFNGLLHIRDDSQSVELIDFFDSETVQKETLHHKQYLIGNKIYFMPDHDKSIHIYDIKNKSVSNISLKILPGCADPIRGVDSFRENQFIWIFFEYAQNPIIKFNTESDTIEELIYYTDDIPLDVEDRGIQVFNTPMSRVGNKIYAAVWKSHYIYEFDLHTKSMYFLDLGEDMELTGIAVNGHNEVYCTLWNSGDIIYYSQNSGMIERIKGKEMQDGLVYSIICAVGEKIIVVSNYSDQIYIISDGRMEDYLQFPKGYMRLSDTRKEWRNFFSYIVKDEDIILCPYASNMKMHINVKSNIANGVIRKLDLNMEQVINEQLRHRQLDEKFKGVYKERNSIDFWDFLEYVSVQKAE